jgi:hypothetical protein
LNQPNYVLKLIFILFSAFSIKWKASLSRSKILLRCRDRSCQISSTKETGPRGQNRLSTKSILSQEGKTEISLVEVWNPVAIFSNSGNANLRNSNLQCRVQFIWNAWFFVHSKWQQLIVCLKNWVLLVKNHNNPWMLRFDNYVFLFCCCLPLRYYYRYCFVIDLLLILFCH